MSDYGFGATTLEEAKRYLQSYDELDHLPTDEEYTRRMAELDAEEETMRADLMEEFEEDKKNAQAFFDGWMASPATEAAHLALVQYVARKCQKTGREWVIENFYVTMPERVWPRALLRRDDGATLRVYQDIDGWQAAGKVL